MSKHNLYATIILFLFAQKLAAQCGCGNCPQNLPDLVDLDFQVQVSGATNQFLGQNGQGLCGVQLNFTHDYVSDLEIKITAPSGQVITLVGPSSLSGFNMTSLTEWNITFLPCSAVAQPDNGIPEVYDNQSPWGILGDYAGSYYPNSGCFDTLTGPVDGTWTITVADQIPDDAGQLLDFQLIFCDPTGIECQPCDAAAGNLPQPDMTLCQKAPNLAPNLPPTYTPGQQLPPPPADYTYNYVVSNSAGGNILAYQNSPNFNGFPVGNYTICGLSVLNDDLPNLPAPNSITLAQFFTLLNSSFPPVCADLTDNCVNVQINPPQPDSVLFDTICAGECIQFFGKTFCKTIDTTLQTAVNGCQINATLHLKNFGGGTMQLRDTVCQGSCSLVGGFPNACVQGIYSKKINIPGGCDSTVLLDLVVLKVNAKIAKPDTLDCQTIQVPLLSTGSTGGSGVSYQWSAVSAGAQLFGATNQATATAITGGTFQLKLCKTFPNGTTCCDSATVLVRDERQSLPTPVGLVGDQTACPGESILFQLTTPTPGATGYNWAVPSGVQIIAGQGTDSLRVVWGNSAGSVCLTAVNGCGVSPSACLSVSMGATPILDQIFGVDTTCRGAVANYSVANPGGVSSFVWTVPSGTTISGNQTGESISLSIGAGVAQNSTICVAGTGSCGTGQQVCIPLVVLNPPAPPTIFGNANGCGGDTLTFSTAELPETAIYFWTGTGGQIIAGQGTTQISFVIAAGATSVSVCLYVENLCGKNHACKTITLGQPPAPPTISGAATVCAGATATFNLSNLATATAFAWTFPAGTTLLGGQNTQNLTLNFPQNSSGSVCATISDKCGTSQPACFSVNVLPLPTANAGLKDSVCGNSISLSAVPSLAGSTGAWSQVAGGGTTVFSNPNFQNSLATVSAAGNYIFRWIENAGGCRDTATVKMDFFAPPIVGQVLENCDGSNQFFEVSFPVAGGTPPFSASSGGSFSGNIFTSDPIPNGSNYSIQITDAAGCVAAPVVGSHDCGCATDAGTMNLTPLDLCQTESATAQANPDAMLDPTDVAVFVLHDSPNPVLGNVFAENTTGVFDFAANLVFNKTYFISRVVGNDLNGSPDPADGCRSVAQGQPVVWRQQPLVFAGVDQGFCSPNFQLAGATDVGQGSWSSSTAGLTFDDPASPVALATAAQVGVFDAIWTVKNFTCTARDTLFLQFFKPMDVASSQVDCDPTSQFFTLKIEVSGGTAPFSAATGGSFSGNIFTSDPIPSGTNFDLVATDANGCELNLSILHTCDCATQGGSMSAAPISVCGSDTAVATVVVPPVLDLNDLSVFVLHDLPGTSLGTVFEKNTTGKFAFQPSLIFGKTYFISMVTGDSLPGLPNLDDPCLKISAGQPVVFHPEPTAAAGADFSVCGQIGNMSATPTTGDSVGIWSQVGGSGLSDFLDFGKANSAVAVSSAGVYFFEWKVETLAGCSAADTVRAEFFRPPTAGLPVFDCDPTNSNFLVKIGIAGGVAPFSMGGVPFVGDTFVSQNLASGASFNFIFSDANGCRDTVAGKHDCLCSTSAGSMNPNLLVECGIETIASLHLGDEKLDGDDVMIFVLHDGSATSLGQILDQNSSGQFTFKTGMAYGQTYFVAAVAGNSVGGAPDPTDPCFKISNGQPVRWSQPVEAGQQTDDFRFCQGVPQVLNLKLLMSNFTPGGKWMETSAVPAQNLDPATGAVTFSDEPAGVYTYIYIVSAESPCADDTLELRLESLPNPTADAGGDQILGCDKTVAELGGSATSSGGQFSIVWTLDGSNFSTLKNPAASDTGTYFLKVVDLTTLCSAVDSAEISSSGDLPTAQIFSKNGDCGAAAASGEIRLENIEGGVEPYSVFLNDSAVGSTTVFQNLAAGNYFLKIEDSAGCEWSSGAVSIAAPDSVSVFLEPEILVQFGDTARLVAQISLPISAVDTFLWTPLRDSAFANSPFQNFLPSNSQFISLAVVDTNGCRGEARTYVRVERKILVFVPNIFSPDSENGNDRLLVFGGTGVEKILNFQIFDRWGERVFEASDFFPNDDSTGWDGRVGGKKVLPGVFVWWSRVLLVDGSEKVLKGDLILK